MCSVSAVRDNAPIIVPRAKTSRTETKYSLRTWPFLFFLVDFRTLPINPQISPHGEKQDGGEHYLLNSRKTLIPGLCSWKRVKMFHQYYTLLVHSLRKFPFTDGIKTAQLAQIFIRSNILILEGVLFEPITGIQDGGQNEIWRLPVIKCVFKCIKGSQRSCIWVTMCCKHTIQVLCIKK